MHVKNEMCLLTKKLSPAPAPNHTLVGTVGNTASVLYFWAAMPRIFCSVNGPLINKSKKKIIIIIIKIIIMIIIFL